jgi:hypothetical protein
MDLLERALQLRDQSVVRRRTLLAAAGVGILCALLVLLRPGLPPEPRQYEVWLAQAEVLVDTSDSRVVDPRGVSLEALAARAILLGNLLATAPLRAGVAARADVDPELLVVSPPAAAATDATAEVEPMPDAGEAPDVPDSEALELSVSTDPSLPIVRVLAQAPDAETAARLADGAVAELSAYVDSVRAESALPDERRLIAEPLGTAVAQPRTRGPGLGTAILAGLLGAALAAAGALALQPPARGGKGRGGEGPVANGRPPRGARERARHALERDPAASKQRKAKRRRPRSPR